MTQLQPCGTQAAYLRHRRYGQIACGPCLKVHNEYTAAWKRGYRHTVTEQRRIESDLRELIAVLAELFEEAS